MTIGELFDKVMACTTEQEAGDLMDELIAIQVAHGTENPVSVVGANVGYVIGYHGGSDAESARVRAEKHALFKAAHPVFGASY